MSLLELILKKTKRDPSKLVAKRPDEDFIPYVCHYDPNTILTKNGELLQIIRITGFSNSSAISELISLRDTVRDAVMDHIKTREFALWFNTIRRKKNITPRGKFPDFFSQKLDEIWTKKNHWDDQYVNELYITVIIEGIDTSIINMKSFPRSFSYLTTKSLHHNFLQEAHKKLSRVVNNILKDTEEYGGKLLGLKEWDGILYSEPMRFFGKIINLYEERYPLAANDISDDLSSHKVAFGDRELEVVGYKNKNFATMFSLKEYFEVSTNSLDRILQLPFEFIITQSFDFTFSKKSLEPFEHQNHLLQISGDEEFRQLSGVANFIESVNNLPTDYGKLQTTIMFISHSREELEKDIKIAFEQFCSLGLLVVREDVFSEHCFWAQLPGNFRFLRRQKLINTHRIAGFAALHNFPAGSIAGNKWGPAVCVLRTVLNTPYFFNFHEGDLGHTLILGPQNSGKKTLLNFLVLQSRKFNNKLFYFDFNNSAKCLFKALSGHYYDMSHHQLEDPYFLQLNPLSLPNNNENKRFLEDFFTSLVAFSKDPVAETELQFIPQIVDRILASNANNFALACKVFNSPETRNIYEKLQIWNGGKLGYVFGSQNEINWNDQLIAFDLTEIHEHKPVLIPVALYLLHRIEMSLDGSPTIIVLNEAFDLVDNIVLGPHIAEFLVHAKQKNCMVIFTATNIEHIATSEIATEIKKHLATEIFMPDSAPHQCYKTIFALNDEEMEIVKMMEKDERHFLLKHGEDSVIATLDLSENVEIAKTLSADEITLTAMQEVIGANTSKQNPNPEPQIWLPQLFEVLKEFENQRLAEEKEKARQEAAEKRRALKKKLEMD